ncbi:MAG: ACT domain-containing protein [Saprospiraceae bacterium]|nr:ACT domain-containing protein [Saprospiraceae bacterium]
MSGEKNLKKILKSLNPVINPGDFVFCSVEVPFSPNTEDILFFFREKQGISVVLNRHMADELGLPYSLLYSWITLDVHSALDGVGLTATFSEALASHHISCNVVAAFYSDHLFIPKKDAGQAMVILQELSQKHQSDTAF